MFRRRRALLVRISDGSGFLNLRFFYFSRAQREGLARGTRLRCVGEARRGPQGLEMVHPEYRRVGNAAEPLDDRLTPIYPLTEASTQGRVRADGQPRAGAACGQSRAGPAARRRGRAPAAAAAARGTGVRASPAGGHIAGDAGRGPASGAAPPGLRGTAGAPAVAAAAEAADPERARAGAARCRRP